MASFLCAARTYNRTLSWDEMLQNRLANLAGYYGFAPSLYSLLSAEEKSELYRALLKMEPGDNRNRVRTGVRRSACTNALRF